MTGRNPTYRVCHWLIGLYSVDQSTAFSILSALVSSSNLPNGVLKNITARSINAALESNSSPTGNLHRLLVSLQQRHPNVVEDVSRLGIDENEGQEASIEHLLLSLSMVRRIGPHSGVTVSHIFRQRTSHPQDTSRMDTVVASMDVNGETRAAAVHAMLRNLRESAAPDSETLVGTLGHVSHKCLNQFFLFTGIFAFRVPRTRA